MLDRSGRPNFLNMRVSRQEREMRQIETERIALRKVEFAKWEVEWAQDGTIPDVGLKWIAVKDGRPMCEPADFATAMVTAWGPWREEFPENWRIIQAPEAE